MRVIETNICCDMATNEILDFQSRIVEVQDWSTYTNAYNNYSGDKVEFKSLDIPGATLLSGMELSDLKYDDHHLSCSLFKFGVPVTKKLAYRIL